MFARLRFSVLVMAPWLGVAAAASAQTVVARIGTREAVVGEAVPVQVTVSDVAEPITPKAPVSSEFEIRMTKAAAGRSERVSIVNGRVTRSVDYTYMFEVTPRKAGVLRLAPFTIDVNGAAIRSGTLVLNVEQGPVGPLFECEIVAPDHPVYVGQTVDLALDIRVQRVRDGALEIDERTMWFGWIVRQLQGSSLGAFADADLQRVTYEPARLPDNEGRTRDYLVYHIVKQLTPLKPGPLDVGDVNISYAHPVRLTRDVFGQIGVDRSLQVRSRPPPPQLIVRAIPEEGRPADFNGAVGQYTISATARPTTVPAGDPITLTLIVRGDGPLEQLAAPRLDRVPALTERFEVPAETLAGTVTGDRKLFTLTIRARREDVTEIPPIPMSYFDPRAERFETSRTQSIPIAVTPAQRLTLPVEDSSSRTALSPVAEIAEGLLANYDDADDALTDETPRIEPFWWIIVAGLPVLNAGAWLVQRRRARFRDDTALRRRAGARAAARRALRLAARTKSPGDAGAAVLGFIADRCNVPAGGLTRADATELIQSRGAPAPVVRRLDAVLAGIESARYGGAPASADHDVAKAARELVDELVRLKLK